MRPIVMANPGRRSTVKIRIALALAAALMLAGCGEDTPTGTEDDSLRVTVRVTDPDGTPLAGMHVNASNALLIEPAAAKAQLKIPFSVGAQALVRIRIRDLDGAVVRTLLDDVLPRGRHEASWDARDDAGGTLPAGLYTVSLAAFETGGSQAALTGSADVFLQRSGSDHSLGVTDADGELVLTDAKLFPGLLLPGEQEAVNADGEADGTFTLLFGATFWTWSDAGGPVAAAIEELVVGANTVVLVWDADAEAAAPDAEPAPATSAAKDEPADWAFGRPYPNPFN